MTRHAAAVGSSKDGESASHLQAAGLGACEIDSARRFSACELCCRILGWVGEQAEGSTLARLIEASAISVLDEATRARLSAATGHRLAMLAALGMAGLDAETAGRLIDETPELSRERS